MLTALEDKIGILKGMYAAIVFGQAFGFQNDI
jgi:hypothetical protein